MSSKSCYCTLVTSDSFVVGAQALLLSVKRFNTDHDLIVLHTAAVAKTSLYLLKRIKGVQLKKVDAIQGPPHPGRTVESWSDFTKLRIWELVEYEAVVYLDADMLVMESVDDLFRRNLGDLGFAAAPDVFPPDKFNAGCLVIRPSQEVFNQLMTRLPELGSYDGGDTGFLNAFFPQWYQAPSDNRLPFSYNAQRTMFWLTIAQPGYWEAIGSKKIIHFSSSPKPWLAPERKGELEMLWWTTYQELIS